MNATLRFKQKCRQQFTSHRKYLASYSGTRIHTQVLLLFCIEPEAIKYLKAVGSYYVLSFPLFIWQRGFCL